MNKTYTSGYGEITEKSKRTPAEFLKDVSLGSIGLLSLPFAYTGRMLMFALAIIYICSREGWIAGKKVGLRGRRFNEYLRLPS